MPLVPFSIDATDPVVPKVHVRGEDLSRQLAAVGFEHRSGEVPRLYLTLHPAGVIEGVAEIVVASDLDQRGIVLSWLDNIDSQMLEQAALEGAGLGDDSTGELFLEALKAMARGD